MVRFEQRVTWVLPKSLQLMKVIGEVLPGHKKSHHAATYHVGLIIYHFIVMLTFRKPVARRLQPHNWLGKSWNYFQDRAMLLLHLAHCLHRKWDRRHLQQSIREAIRLEAHGMCICHFQSQCNLIGFSPVDVSSREKEVAHRLERDREANLEKIAMSRSNSRTGMDRNLIPRPQTPPAPLQSKLTSAHTLGPTLAPTVRPSLSFANVAAKKEGTTSKTPEERSSNSDEGQSTEINTKVVS